jgi:hypothetical protein
MHNGAAETKGGKNAAEERGESKSNRAGDGPFPAAISFNNNCSGVRCAARATAGTLPPAASASTKPALLPPITTTKSGACIPIQRQTYCASEFGPP